MIEEKSILYILTLFLIQMKVNSTFKNIPEVQLFSKSIYLIYVFT